MSHLPASSHRHRWASSSTASPGFPATWNAGFPDGHPPAVSFITERATLPEDGGGGARQAVAYREEPSDASPGAAAGGGQEGARGWGSSARAGELDGCSQG